MRFFAARFPAFTSTALLTPSPTPASPFPISMVSTPHCAIAISAATFLTVATPAPRGHGLDVVDLSVSRQIHNGIEFNFAIDNLNNKSYYETQNYLESRVSPDAPIIARVHGTPGY